MPTPINQALYEKVKMEADKVYSKPSAYKSGYIVKTYKERGGTYSGKREVKGLTNWFQSKWVDVGNGEYPVYRPTKRVNRFTPLTVSEIDATNLREQIALKQKIRGRFNLPPFIAKN